MNIRAYKVRLPDGNPVFEIKKNDSGGGCECSNILTLAKTVKEVATRYFEENNFSQVSIDFSPFHDIECASGLSPKLCIALSEKEKQKFWKYYNS